MTDGLEPHDTIYSWVLTRAATMVPVTGMGGCTRGAVLGGYLEGYIPGTKPEAKIEAYLTYLEIDRFIRPFD